MDLRLLVLVVLVLAILVCVALFWHRKLPDPKYSNLIGMLAVIVGMLGIALPIFLSNINPNPNKSPGGDVDKQGPGQAVGNLSEVRTSNERPPEGPNQQTPYRNPRPISEDRTSADPGEMTITPPEGGIVDQIWPFHATGRPPAGYLYPIVTDGTNGSQFIDGPLNRGFGNSWAGTAVFGEPDTLPKTKYYLSIIHSIKKLHKGAISQLPNGSNEISNTIQVNRR